MIRMPLISSEPMQQVIAGPPKCDTCGSIMQIWIPASTRDKVPPYKPFLWICPNYCNVLKAEDDKDV